MSRPKKEYIYPLIDGDDKQKIRNWIGTHNGISILRSDWCYFPDGVSLDSYETYILGITNPKTELLFTLTFPMAIEKKKYEDNRDKNWDWTNYTYDVS